MKKLLIIIMIHGLGQCSLAGASKKQCWLSYDETGKEFVDCRIGPKPKNYKRICKMKDNTKIASLYKVEVKKRDDAPVDRSIVDDALEFVGLAAKKKAKKWKQGYELKEGEYIECSIDDTKKQKMIDDRKAKRKAEKAARDKRKSDWQSACDTTTDPVSKMICAEKGM